MSSVVKFWKKKAPLLVGFGEMTLCYLFVRSDYFVGLLFWKQCFQRKSLIILRLGSRATKLKKVSLIRSQFWKLSFPFVYFFVCLCVCLNWSGKGTTWLLLLSWRGEERRFFGIDRLVCVTAIRKEEVEVYPDFNFVAVWRWRTRTGWLMSDLRFRQLYRRCDGLKALSVVLILRWPLVKARAYVRKSEKNAHF